MSRASSSSLCENGSKRLARTSSAGIGLGGRERRLGVRFRENSRSGDQRLHRRARSCGRTDELGGATGAGIANGPESSSRLVDAPEYRFFRTRYPRGADGETALLILTDATIRRWCGPRWRIASSRRVRTAAALAEMQAANLAAIVAGSGLSQRFNAPPLTLLIGSRPGRAAYLSHGHCFVTLRHTRIPDAHR